jgi:Sulfotransferase domain
VAIDRLKISLARRDVLGLREKLTGRSRKIQPADHDATRAEPGGIKPENIIWIFGTGRTGSTWLGRMMGDLEDHSLWHEPYVGEIFGSAYYVRAWDRQREREGYILSRAYKQVWLRSVRDLILDGARARYPDTEGYLVIKEPHGSIAAPLLMEALPESRMVFLVRDPRDVAASRLDAHKKGSWARKLTGKTEETLADRDPDAFVKAAAGMYLQDMEKVKYAYDTFGGRKALVKYEELRADTVEEMKRMYSRLGIPVAEEQLRRIAEKYDWENIPEKRKGAGKSHRKASPGSWREDLTPEQVTIVEKITAPVLDEFYVE